MHQQDQLTTNSHKATFDDLAWVTLNTFTLIGSCFAAFAMYAAWQRNPQGEFHDEHGVHWLDWISIGVFWFVIIAGVPWLLAISSRFRH